MNKSDAIRARILDAAESQMQTSGEAMLSQTKVAAAVGMRQSHLQYYFPKRIDLVAALLQRHMDMVDRADEIGMREAFGLILSDPGRMRFFLALVAEADREPVLRELLARHLEQIQASVALWFAAPPNDRAVHTFLAALRGFGMVALATGQPPATTAAEIAQGLGLRWPGN